MRAVVFDAPGDESVLRVAEVPEPAPATGEVRIAVAGAGVNRADLLQRRGLYPPPPGASPLLGLEVSGTVAELGDGVTELAVGDRVMALLTGGGYAAEVVTPAGCVMQVPPAVDLVHAGGLPEVLLTAYLNLFRLGGLEPGMTALVHGGSGGVGTAAIQLCRTVGARIVVTAGTDDRCRRCLELGADAAVNHRSGNFVAAALDLTDGAGADVVIDCVGGSYLEQHLEVIRTGGRLVLIGLLGGARAELDLARVLRKRVTLIGSTLRSRSTADKAELVAGLVARFGSCLEDGTVAPVIDRVLPLDQAGEAHRALAAGRIFGKVVLRP